MNLPMHHVDLALLIAREQEAEIRRRHVERELRRGGPPRATLRGRLARLAAAVAREADGIARRLDPEPGCRTA